ncbi:hypothetical protein P7C70_g2597, partial [Phenoliferia sp. Uapishka_3]
MSTTSPPTLSPTLALDLRLRFLSTLLTGSLAPSRNQSDAISLTRRADLIQARLKEALDTGGGGDAVRRFVQGYELNAPLLRLPPAPSLALEEMSPQAKVALILESEGEIRQLERELREVETLEHRGVVGSGNLADHEGLKPALAEVKANVTPQITSYSSLEARTNALLSRYNEYIDTLSEIFISWNDIISSAEEEITKLEKERFKGEDIS